MEGRRGIGLGITKCFRKVGAMYASSKAQEQAHTASSQTSYIKMSIRIGSVPLNTGSSGEHSSHY